MSHRVVIIDNYDSFTHNLSQGFASLGATVTVVRNDRVTLSHLEDLAPERLVLSPGPGSPGGSVESRPGSVFARFADRTATAGAPSAPPMRRGMGGSGISAAALAHFRGTIPVLGVCLGHQLIAEAHGARLVPAHVPVHGKRWSVHHESAGIFNCLPTPFEAARYHSLTVAPQSVPQTLRSVAWTDDGEIMGLGVVGEATWGVQFHPESYMTPLGARLMESFLEGVVCDSGVVCRA